MYHGRSSVAGVRVESRSGGRGTEKDAIAVVQVHYGGRQSKRK